MSEDHQESQLLHATCVALKGDAVLILGPSGSGKSSLAFALMAFGARLVSDDQTLIRRRGDRIWAEAPQTILGRIEARGIGILAAEPLRAAALSLVIDLSENETERLPPHRTRMFLGMPLTCLHNVATPHFPAMILHYLKSGRID